MKILITGAAGFIGSHLGNQLSGMGYPVYGVDDYSHPSNNKLDFDCKNMDASVFTGNAVTTFDAIFHLAAHINVDESITDPLQYFDNNANLTLKYLESMRTNGFTGKFIYASSAEVYGTAQREMMDEDHPLDPLSPYAVSKLAAEQMCKNYAQLYGLDITVVRNFNTFGEHQRGGLYGGVIAKFKGQGRTGTPLTVYGSGEQMRDYMHISQAVNGYLLALNSKLPTIVNFGSGNPVKIIDIANFVAKKFNGQVTHTHARPNEIMRLQADVTRAKHYGYEVETDFYKHLDAYLDYAD